MVTGAMTLTAPLCVVVWLSLVLFIPRADEDWPSSPTALSCAVMGAFTLATALLCPVPTEVVEQLLVPLAATAPETEHTFTGASTLATWPVCEVLPEVAEPWAGSCCPPTSLSANERGTATATGALDPPDALSAELCVVTGTAD